MIVRIWTTGVTPGRERDYLAFARNRSRPMFLAQPGCLGVLFLRAEDGSRAACSFWRAPSDVEALATSTSYQSTAAALGGSGILSGTPALAVYEVEGGVLDAAALARWGERHGGAEPGSEPEP